MDQLLAIRAFARVVEAGNFTKAADSLQLPKATVSKLVQTLEAHLGVQLLQRTTRRIVITPDGSAYYDKSARVLKELEDIDASFSAAHARPPAGTFARGSRFFSSKSPARTRASGLPRSLSGYSHRPWCV